MHALSLGPDESVRGKLRLAEGHWRASAARARHRQADLDDALEKFDEAAAAAARLARSAAGRSAPGNPIAEGFRPRLRRAAAGRKTRLRRQDASAASWPTPTATAPTASSGAPATCAACRRKKTWSSAPATITSAPWTCTAASCPTAIPPPPSRRVQESLDSVNFRLNAIEHPPAEPSTPQGTLREAAAHMAVTRSRGGGKRTAHPQGPARQWRGARASLPAWLAAGLLVAFGLYRVYQAKAPDPGRRPSGSSPPKQLLDLNDLGAREDLLPALGFIPSQNDREEAARKIYYLSGGLPNVGAIRPRRHRPISSASLKPLVRGPPPGAVPRRVPPVGRSCSSPRSSPRTLLAEPARLPRRPVPAAGRAAALAASASS